MGTKTAKCACGLDAERVFSVPSVVIPAWMSDDAMDGRRKHRGMAGEQEAKGHGPDSDTVG